MYPSQVEQAVYLMNAPLSYTSLTPNNIWMHELPEQERQPDHGRAMAQWLDLYGYIASQALVYVLPTPQEQLQDLTFVANLGVTLAHVGHEGTFVASNFTSPPRTGEQAVGRRFFEQFGYNIYIPNTKFEGEADLKHIYDNVYVGGYGQRSQRETYDWMARQFGMTIIPVRLQDEHLYHLDCSIFPLTPEHTLVCTEMLEEAELDALAEHTDIIDVSVDSAYVGICNCVRLHQTLLCATDIHDLTVGTQEYDWERTKVHELEGVAERLGLELTLFNLSEYAKAGALLSCLVMHLNRWSYAMDGDWTSGDGGSGPAAARQ